jgi:hypothetical protein
MKQNINQSADMDNAIIKSTLTNRLDKYLNAIKYAMSAKTLLDNNMEKVFIETFYSLGWIVPILEDVLPSGEHTVDEAFIAVYGEDSDAVLLLNEFLQEFEQMQM